MPTQYSKFGSSDVGSGMNDPFEMTLNNQNIGLILKKHNSKSSGSPIMMNQLKMGGKSHSQVPKFRTQQANNKIRPSLTMKNIDQNLNRFGLGLGAKQ